MKIKHVIRIVFLSFFTLFLAACNDDPVKTEYIQYHEWEKTQQFSSLQRDMWKIMQVKTAEEAQKSYEEIAVRLDALVESLKQQSFNTPEVKSIQNKMIEGFTKLSALFKESAKYFTEGISPEENKRITKERQEAVRIINEAIKESNQIIKDHQITFSNK